MNIKTNHELQQAVNKAIEESGIKKTFIADKLGISRQAFYKMINEKESFSLDDANKILSLLNQETETVIKKVDKK
ncbi:helix-turn-helix domain-containing protein [Konateibacter massiliensis]|uniref:helix-turn-helix domain-containing protein n=1 Tax=Konateibacter massiliensis TaxID=2002841 RepID=UPI000C15C5A0|nr:helix-turn-helix transcriptional regulator [Konateibacter massiliensis]